ncbi:hypothetical protein FOA52_004177 [Chlamydomonas sp. UWO 241]|nr:hypothetical protein FOA52_004177 [Chlamydomonas sp. UWO 241]
MFVPVYVDDTVTVHPRCLHGGVNTHILEKLRTMYEGKCSRHGYIKAGSIEVARYEQGQVVLMTLNGDVSYKVSFKAHICHPVGGDVVEGTLVTKNGFGALVEVSSDGESGRAGIMDVIVTHRDNPDIATKAVGQRLRVVINGCQFNMGSAKITAYGDIAADGTSPVAGGFSAPGDGRLAPTIEEEDEDTEMYDDDEDKDKDEDMDKEKGTDDEEDEEIADDEEESDAASVAAEAASAVNDDDDDDDDDGAGSDGANSDDDDPSDTETKLEAYDRVYLDAKNIAMSNGDAGGSYGPSIAGVSFQSQQSPPLHPSREKPESVPSVWQGQAIEPIAPPVFFPAPDGIMKQVVNRMAPLEPHRLVASTHLTGSRSLWMAALHAKQPGIEMRKLDDAMRVLDEFAKRSSLKSAKASDLAIALERNVVVVDMETHVVDFAAALNPKTSRWCLFAKPPGADVYGRSVAPSLLAAEAVGAEDKEAKEAVAAAVKAEIRRLVPRIHHRRLAKF